MKRINLFHTIQSLLLIAALLFTVSCEGSREQETYNGTPDGTASGVARADVNSILGSIESGEMMYKFSYIDPDPSYDGLRGNFSGMFSVHQPQTMCPDQKIEYGNICGEIKHSFASENAVDQRDADEPTVGVYGSEPLNIKIRISFFTDKYPCNQNSDAMCGESSTQRQQESFYQLCVVVDLIYCDDQA